MQALQRLGIIVTTVGLAVCGVSNTANALPILLEEQGTLSLEDSVLDDGSLYDQHRFSGSSGQQVTIYLESDDFDPYLILLDPARRRISENDDISRTNRNSRLVITLPSTGTYTVVANSYESGKTGSYTLKVAGEGSNISRAIAQEMVTAAVPNGSLICSSAILSAMDMLNESREIDVLVDAVQLRQAFRTVPPTRPNGISMGLNGPAAISVMFSPQFLAELSRQMIRDCATLGAVIFEATEAGFDRTFGYLPALRRQNPTQVPVGEFICVGSGSRNERTLPEWGEQMCL